MAQTTTSNLLIPNLDIENKSIRDRLNEIAACVREEREDTSVKTYKYREDKGHFSVSLNPVVKRRSR
jgi:hypothetical protein